MVVSWSDLQLGQASVNPPRLILEVVDFNFAGSHPWEFPPHFKVQSGGDYSIEVWGFMLA